MSINRVTLAGYTGKDAQNSSTQSGRSITRLSIATTKRYKDAQQQWKEKTEWHRCVAYGATAEYCSKIQTGAHVFLEGELKHREYERTIEAEGGPVKVMWPVTEVVIAGLRKRSRAFRETMRRNSVYCVECLCGYHIESEASTAICPGCQRLVGIEWPAVEREEEPEIRQAVESPAAA